MNKGIRRRILFGFALATPFIRTARANPIRMRVSLDTGPNHGRTLAVADFLKKLEAASQGEIAPHLFESGHLFADLDVIKALVLGKVEMAAPGTWLVADYVPEADFGQLPVFYGQPVEATYRAIDGMPGTLVNQQITSKLRVTIPGRWMDLGFFNWYSVRIPLTRLEDLKGLVIRNPGGFGQAWRARYFGAKPVTTAWPDAPLTLSEGTIDALQTTNESCASARLWDAGLRHALIDHQAMGNYIPMLSETFWGALTPALKSVVTDLWTANIEAYRSDLAVAQDKAEKELKPHGMKVSHVSPDELAKRRKQMMLDQDRVALEMKISVEFMARANEAATASG